MAEIIQSLWIGRPLSLIEQLSITSFLGKGYEYHLYCYKKIEGIPHGVIVRDAAEILPASEIFYYPRGAGRGSVAAFANLFRYKLLLERGGWWMDTDMVCLRRLDFAEPVVFAGQRVPGGTQATNSAIKLPQGHAVSRQCHEAASREDRKKMSWGKTGPFLLDRVVEENGLRQSVKAPEFFCPLDYWEWESLLAGNPDSLARLMTAETRTVHLWHEQWRRAGIELDPATRKPRSKRFFKRFWRLLEKRPKSAPGGTTPIAELLRQCGL
jgi:hypothetical protein